MSMKHFQQGNFYHPLQQFIIPSIKTMIASANFLQEDYNKVKHGHANNYRIRSRKGVLNTITLGSSKCCIMNKQIYIPVQHTKMKIKKW